MGKALAGQQQYHGRTLWGEEGVRKPRDGELLGPHNDMEGTDSGGKTLWSGHSPQESTGASWM